MGNRLGGGANVAAGSGRTSRGRVVDSTSIGGLAAEPSYRASKGAGQPDPPVRGRPRAGEDRRVRDPGFLAAAMVRPFFDDPEPNKTLHDVSDWPHPGTAEDVGKLALSLASDDARVVAGSVQALDGGRTAG